MTKKRLKRKAFFDSIKARRRLVIINEETFEEQFSLKLSILNVFILGSLGAIFLISVTSYIIAFTPLREYIPGYSSTQLKQDALLLGIKADSLEFQLNKNDEYIKSVKKVLTGDLEYAKVNKDSILASDYVDPSEYEMEAGKAELELRKQVQKEAQKK
ncbi:peptidase [Flavobacterium amniphilum]|uniref:peptidase n=1 Tax=Flavobacterium amniphilum TaxID=1834035 RepID=UPI00202A3B06|nr:peptidase [Flavobacterium amniphilum]MCL9804101.1 peptidase [Flavobacterium amniphilum]